MGHGVAPDVLIVADGASEAGLGHLSRSSSVAVALRSRGVPVHCHALGATSAIGLEGLEWVPINSLAELGPTEATGTVVVDSYRVSAVELAALTDTGPVVVMHDGETPPSPRVDLVVAVSGDAAVADARHLYGLQFACLRPAFWGVPRRTLSESVERVLVTTGARDTAGTGAAFAEAIRRAVPDVDVVLVRGPHGSVSAAASVHLLDAPQSLLHELLRADVVVSAGGQTMLEAAAAGTPCVAVVLADNQRSQTASLAGCDAVVLIDPPEPPRVAAAVSALVRSYERRRALSGNAQRVVDGYGALRVAFWVAMLRRRTP